MFELLDQTTKVDILVLLILYLLFEYLGGSHSVPDDLLVWQVEVQKSFVDLLLVSQDLRVLKEP